MGRIGVTLDDDLEAQLKNYALRTTGNFRSQSEIVAKAVKEYLEKYDTKIGEQGNFNAQSPMLEPILA
jgi:metal-responsive CopG/Arc/MetJ family transcriptional regulator